MAEQHRHDELQAGTIALLADCHIHPGQIDWPAAVLAALAGCEAILTLGDMGEAAGLDALAKIAPVLGVKGGDDAEDERTAPAARTFAIGGLTIGAVFDAVKSGLATNADPFGPAVQFDAAAERLFGRKIDVLMHGGTHKSSLAFAHGKLILDPGSATLPADKDSGAPGTFICLDVGKATLCPRIITL